MPQPRRVSFQHPQSSSDLHRIRQISVLDFQISNFRKPPRSLKFLEHDIENNENKMWQMRNWAFSLVWRCAAPWRGFNTKEWLPAQMIELTKMVCQLRFRVDCCGAVPFVKSNRYCFDLRSISKCFSCLLCSMVNVDVERHKALKALSRLSLAFKNDSGWQDASWLTWSWESQDAAKSFHLSLRKSGWLYRPVWNSEETSSLTILN